ncbi:MAG: HDOD domain-containing protein [Deltaproteobacteria bacterium]|nr:HDOD domain-containing protein [Deltaproteobacteria bacterium]
MALKNTIRMKREHIFSGSFVVSTEKSVVYESLLGTCVGVAAYDKKNRSGGLLHILLPEPISYTHVDEPAKFATTALPIFLNELVKQGSAFENLEVVIAGGALVGPVSMQDINLDIGGRTIEIVKGILAQQNISVIKSETGGFFSCNLSLDMSCGEFSITPKTIYTMSGAGHKIPAKEEIDYAFEKLQPIPQVALKILRMVNDGYYSIENIAEEVKKDQVITAKIIKLCNSSFFAMKREIDSLDDALSIIGMDKLIKIIISNSVKKFYNQSSSGYSLCMGGLFHHAVGTSAIAEGLAKKTEIVSPGVAYTAGLLHDLGGVMLDQFFNKSKPFFYREFEKSEAIASVENNVFGINHLEIGKKIAKSWNFPSPLVDVIMYHHDPEKAQRNKELVNIIYIADFIMERFSRGVFADQNPKSLEYCLKSLNLTMDSIPEIVEMIPSKTVDLLT